jgi:hypothetical protein
MPSWKRVFIFGGRRDKMFSTVNRFQTRKDLLAKLVKLNDEEQKELESAEKTILSGSKRARFLLASETLTDFNHIEKLFKFSVNSACFKTFCLENEFSHIDTWKTILKMLSYSGEDVISLDRKEVISIFDQYLGAYFYSEYLRFKAGDKSIEPAQAELYLDLASEKGLFNALVARCEYNRGRIKSSNISNEMQTDALTQLKSDAKRLGNLYWVVGLLHASLVLLDIGNYFANEESASTDVLAHTLQKTAAKKFLQAQELSIYKALDQNEKIVKNICGKKGLMIFEFSDWDVAQAFFLQHVDSARAPHDTLIAEARKEIRKHVNFSRHAPQKDKKTQGR